MWERQSADVRRAVAAARKLPLTLTLSPHAGRGWRLRRLLRLLGAGAPALLVRGEMHSPMALMEGERCAGVSLSPRAGRGQG